MLKIKKIIALSFLLFFTSCSSIISEIRNIEPFLNYDNFRNNEKISFKLLKENALENDEIKFIAFGDFGKADKNQYDVAKAIEKKCFSDGCDFGLLLGDNFYTNGVKNINDEQFIEKFEKPYKNLDFKFYATLGNHDYRGNTYAQIRYTKKSKKWVMPRRTYNFKKNFIEFYSIDSNDPSNEQEKELSKAILNSSANWKIVFGHHPRYSNGLHGDASEKVKKMLDKSLCNNVDMYISGHDHHKEHLKSVCGVEYLIVGTGGATLRPVFKSDNSIFSASTFGFAWFKVTKEKLFFQIIDINGKVEYEYLLKK